MIVLADNNLRACWALQHADTKVISLGMISERKGEAHALRAGLRLYQPERGEWNVVAVFVALSPAQ